MTLWIEETERCLKKAREIRLPEKDRNTRQLAGFIVAIEEGSFGMVKSMADKRIYASLYNSLRDCLLSKAEADS